MNVEWDVQHAWDSMFWLRMQINCYGVGDCLIGSQFMTASGGFRDEADEGAHPFDLQVAGGYGGVSGDLQQRVYAGIDCGDGIAATVHRERRARDGT